MIVEDEIIRLGFINPKRVKEIDHFYIKKENGLHWLCHQFHGSVESDLQHCVPISEKNYEAIKQEYSSFIEENKKL